MTDKWTRWKQYRAWRAPSGSDNLGEKTMDSNFGGAYLDECDDRRNRYDEARNARKIMIGDIVKVLDDDAGVEYEVVDIEDDFVVARFGDVTIIKKNMRLQKVE